MQYVGLAVVVALLAIVTALVAVRMLAGGQWLLGWLRGTLGMLVLSLAGLVGLVAWDFTTYQSLGHSSPLVSLTFQADGRPLLVADADDPAIAAPLFTLDTVSEPARSD